MGSGLGGSTCITHVVTSVSYSWLPLLLHRRQSWQCPHLKTPAFRSESTIGTTKTTMSGMTEKTGPTGSIVRKIPGALTNSRRRAKGSNRNTGTGATVIQIRTSYGEIRKTEPAMYRSTPAKREGLRVTGGASLVCFLAQFVLSKTGTIASAFVNELPTDHEEN